MTAAPQFGVHRSPSRSAVKPFVVIVQSNDFQRMPTRVVAPLVPVGALPGLEDIHPRVAPQFVVRGRAYRLNPLDIATLGIHRLGEQVASFADDEDAKRRIQDALDAILKPY